MTSNNLCFNCTPACALACAYQSHENTRRLRILITSQPRLSHSKSKPANLNRLSLYQAPNAITDLNYFLILVFYYFIYFLYVHSLKSQNKICHERLAPVDKSSWFHSDALKINNLPSLCSPE